MIPALAMSGLDPARERNPRDLIADIAGTAFPAIQLDATHPGLRARELDRSARRDLAAILRRGGLVLAGFDCLIPPTHLISTQHQDRALSAIVVACELAADLASLTQSPAGVVSIESPTPEVPDAIIRELSERSARFDVRLADLNPSRDDPRLAVAIDPASCLLAGVDPAHRTLQADGRLASARLSDHDGAGRVAPLADAGRLDTLPYLVALRTVGYVRPIVVDFRAVRDPLTRAAETLAAWNSITL